VNAEGSVAQRSIRDRPIDDLLGERPALDRLRVVRERQ
jgi:hypothetical protein